MQEKKSAMWYEINFKTGDLRIRREIRGVPTEVFASPYDIPEAIRAYVLKDLDTLRVELRYPVEDEERSVVKKDAMVTYEIGKFSKRLYALNLKMKSELVRKNSEIDVKLNATEINRAIDGMSVAKNNSSLVKEAIKDYKSMVAVA